MNNKELATELASRCGGVPVLLHGMILEAAGRLLQMVPDEPFMPGIKEADSLRRLAVEWPLKEDNVIPPDEYLRMCCGSAANRLEQMAETIDYARTIQAEGVRLKAELEKVQAERDAMAAYLKKINGCGCCKHKHCDVDEEPCESCMEGRNFPAWEWRGDRE